jgi:hypothetical protein
MVFDGTRLKLTNTDDADLDAISGCLITGGDGTGAHLAFDNNEIMAKSDATTAASLYLQNDGGTVKFGANTNLTTWEVHGTDGGNKIFGSGSILELHTTAAGDKSGYIGFFNDSDTRMGYIGYAQNDDIHIRNENAGGNIYFGTQGAGSGYACYITSAGNFVPYNDNASDLGSSTRCWEHLWLGQGNTFSSGGYWTLRSRDSDQQVMEYTSSERFKKDIVDLPLEEAYQILDARPIKFRGIEDDASVPLEAGLSAESLHEAGFEYAVRYDEGHWGETPRAVYYEMLTAPLIKIVKDLKDRIEVLEG